GRLVQGLGGGLEAATAYVVIRTTFPEQIWSRTIALLSTSWSVSVLLGPLVGGTFASLGSWRGAFVTTAVIAAILGAAASVVLPASPSTQRVSGPGLPLARVALICGAIAAVSLLSIAAPPFAVVLVVIAALALVVMLKLDRAATNRLMPRDAFSWH